MKKFRSIFLLITLLVCFAGCEKSRSYEEIKADTVSFLKANQTALEAAAQKTIQEATPTENPFEEISNIRYDTANGYVVFDMDAQGMLGGQYWSLIYTPTGTYMEEPQTYFYSQEDGNNLQFAEKIHDNWFFLWEDYDGREDLLNIQ